jgi:hypothetical protein
MRRLHISVSGFSILLALLLAAFEFYFFWYAGQNVMGPLGGTLGLFTADRLGFNLAWVAAIYLSYQLISIPFALPGAQNRFVGVIDGLASLIPLGVVVVVMFGKPQLLGTHERWEAATILLFVTAIDLFGGYTFNIALSRRMFDIGAPGPSM